MKNILIGAALAAIASQAGANDYAPAMQSFVDNEAVGWISDPAIINAIVAQNARTAGLSQDEIDSLDLTWRAEVGMTDSPTISPVLNSSASDFLRDIVGASDGVITEVFAMDARGLNVAASSVTSDYWQGDEAKFSETYPKGPGSVHFGEVEFDESSQMYQGQVSIAIVDPASNEVIGAVTIGLDAEALM